MTPIRIIRHIALQRRQRRRVAERSGVNLLLRTLGTVLLAVLVLIMGILVLIKYRRVATGGDRVMAVIGMVSVALLSLLTIVLLLIFLLAG